MVETIDAAQSPPAPRAPRDNDKADTAMAQGPLQGLPNSEPDGRRSRVWCPEDSAQCMPGSVVLGKESGRESSS